MMAGYMWWSPQQSPCFHLFADGGRSLCRVRRISGSVLSLELVPPPADLRLCAACRVVMIRRRVQAGEPPSLLEVSGR